MEKLEDGRQKTSQLCGTEQRDDRARVVQLICAWHSKQTSMAAEAQSDSGVSRGAATGGLTVESI